MKRADLNVGDRVWVHHTMHDKGIATILDLDAEPGRYDRPSYTVRIRWRPGYGSVYLRERNVSLRAIIRLAGEAA